MQKVVIKLIDSQVAPADRYVPNRERIQTLSYSQNAGNKSLKVSKLHSPYGFGKFG